MLLEIDSNPGISQTALARLMSVEGPTLIQMIERLESQGLLRRERRANDRRRYAIYLTRAGEEASAAVRRFNDKQNDLLLKELVHEERALLLSLLQRVVKRGQSVLDQDLRAAEPLSEK